MMKPLSAKITLWSLVATIAVMGVATIAESRIGTRQINANVYGTVWFSLMWGIVAVASIILLKQRYRNMRPASLMLHAAFILILAGALLTRLTSERGMLHLRAGEPTATYTDENAGRYRLPFTVTLDRFETEYYPGTLAPSDYVSEITLIWPDGNDEQRQISMNNIASVEGWRLYQSSFDEDGRGSWISLNRDRYGIPVTYAGYVMLFISFIWMLVEPRGRFRSISSRLFRRVAVITIPFLLVPSQEAAASPATLSKKAAATFGRVQLLFNDRIAPFQTVASDFTSKLSGDREYNGYTSEQVTLGWLFYPEEWQYEPMIKIKSRALRQELRLREYAAFVDFFDSGGRYILEPYCRKAYRDAADTPLNLSLIHI